MLENNCHVLFKNIKKKHADNERRKEEMKEVLLLLKVNNSS